MKKIWIVVLLVISLSIHPVSAQVVDLITLVTNKVIKAIDLKVQEMQNAVIALQLEQKQAENQLSKKKLGEIAGWEAKQKELYAGYFASLKQVKPILASDAPVLKIRQQQKSLLDLYSIAVSKLKQDTHLNETEKRLAFQSYDLLIDQSSIVVASLEKILADNLIRATDAERLNLILTCCNRMDSFFLKFMSIYKHNQQLSLKRAKMIQENLDLKQLYR